MRSSYFSFISMLPLIFISSHIKAQNDSLNKAKYQEEFRKNCKCSIHYPGEAEEKHIQGTVIVAFDIDSTCSLTNIRVEKGIGYGCDEEAIRVFKECQRQMALRQKSNCIPGKGFRQPIKFLRYDED